MNEAQRTAAQMTPGFATRQQGPQGQAFSALLDRYIRDPRSGQMRAVDFFVYSTVGIVIAALGAGTADINIQGDSDFLAVAGIGTVRDAAAANAADVDRRVLVNVTDSGSGRLIFDRAQDFDDVFGTSQRPSWYPVPKFLPRSSTLTVQVTDLRNRASTVRVAFWGIKIFGTNMGG